MHTIIVANAPGFDAAPFSAQLRAAALLIAADGGGNALHAVGISPALVIGDLDSLSEQAAASFAVAGAEFQRHPAAKDETDLELALLMALERGATSIDILGGLGGRWDQSLSNVALLALPELAGTPVRLLDHEQEAFLVRDEAAIVGQLGDTVSLLPIGGPAHGITTSGLHYPLHEATLHFERTRGISNVISARPASVSLRQGLLLVVHTFSQ
jgi:thiamine pyrophosphokinase